MQIQVKRLDIKLQGDPARVIAKPFFLSKERTLNLVRQILTLPEEEVNDLLMGVLRDFAMRHRSISRIFEANYKRASKIMEGSNIATEGISHERRLLIGSYLTHEYSIEGAAFFNPSIIEAPEQTGLEIGQKRAILSMRATGEGHISSIVFRQIVIDAKNQISIMPPARRVEVSDVVKDYFYKKRKFIHTLSEMDIPMDICHQVLDQLPEKFTYEELMAAQKQVRDPLPANSPTRVALQKIIWLADSHYELHFSFDTDISERVIFPTSDFESRGIEDARFVRFTEDNGKATYYATYCAYNGLTVLPKLIQTADFYNFKIKPLHGHGAQNKNLALFPRKINGKYVMLSRIDGINNYIMMSDQLTVWENPILLQTPIHPWELVQIGNCGSPIETNKGWLLITHGVGPMRRYCLGATLLDLDDPTKEIGRLKNPLLVPNKEEREGYVPNVVYSCGSLVSNGDVIVPYAMSDSAAAFMTVPLDDLIDTIIEDSQKG